MEQLGLALLASVLVLFMVLGVWIGLRRKDTFWDEDRKGPRRSRGAKERRPTGR